LRSSSAKADDRVRPRPAPVERLGAGVEQRDADQGAAGEAHHQVQPVAAAQDREAAEHAREDGGGGER
jgi:hypothetical protein